MKYLPGWQSILWICKELWRDMKLKKICACDSGFTPSQSQGIASADRSPE
jgi:hypothetical protein